MLSKDLDSLTFSQGHVDKITIIYFCIMYNIFSLINTLTSMIISHIKLYKLNYIFYNMNINIRSKYVMRINIGMDIGDIVVTESFFPRVSNLVGDYFYGHFTVVL